MRGPQLSRTFKPEEKVGANDGSSKDKAGVPSSYPASRLGSYASGDCVLLIQAALYKAKLGSSL